MLRGARSEALRKVATTDFVREFDLAQLSDFHVCASLPEFLTAHKDGNFFFINFYLHDGLCRKEGTAHCLSASSEALKPHGINKRFSFN